MKKNRIFPLFLALTLGFSCLSCGEASVPSETVTTDTTVQPEETTALTRENTPDSLPDGLDFGGKTFTIHYFDQNAAEWEAESETGEIINDTVYRRSRTVEERLNVKLAPFFSGVLTDYNGTIKSTLSASILAGTGDFDLIAGYAAYITRGMEGYLTNLNDVPYLDFSQPWWISEMKEAMTIGDCLYFMTGDLGMSVMQNFDACFFNSSVAEKYSLGDLFELVFDGKWTLDEMNRCIKAVAQDVDSDGKITDAGNDIVGVTLFDKFSGLDAFLGGFRCKITQKNSSGEPELCLNSERSAMVIEKLLAMFGTDGAILPAEKYPLSKQTGLKLLSEGKSLFFIDRLLGAETDVMRSMKDDWGVLPVPKLDDTQEDYGVFLCDSYSLFCIPLDCKDLKMAGAVTEALAAENYRHLTEAYYSVALQSKYARSEESVRVLEMLRENVCIDFGYNYTGIGASYFIRNIVGSANNAAAGFASWYASNEGTMKSTLQSTIEAYRK